GVDLADAGLHQHDGHAVEPSLAKGVAAAHDLVIDRQRMTEMADLLREGGDDPERACGSAHAAAALRSSTLCAPTPVPCRRRSGRWRWSTRASRASRSPAGPAASARPLPS